MIARFDRHLLYRTGAGLAMLLMLATAPVSAQIEADAAARLDSIAGAGVRDGRSVGLVAAVVKGADTLMMKAYGLADVEWEVPMTVDAMFEIGSIAKQFTAAAILQLRDAGRLALDDRLTKWLPELGSDTIGVTLRQLLNHTSGIFQFGETRDWEANMFIPGVRRDSAVGMIRLEPVQFPAGRAQAYNNSGFWLLGLVVERASGMTFESYLDQRIFTPLGMTRSMYCDSRANIPRRAHGYGLQSGTIMRAPMVSYSWVFAPGAICSTAGDLVTWLQALHGGRVLSPESYAEMTTPARLEDGTALRYGLGIKIGEDYRGLRYIGHGGTAPGFRADATWYPEGGMAVVVLMNTSPTNLPPAGVGGALARTVLPVPRPEIERYTGDATGLVGTYRYVIGGNRPFDVEVTSTPQGLAFAVNGGRPEPLPWAGGLTFYAQENVTLTFRGEHGGDGPVIELRRDDAGNHQILRKDR